MRSYARRSDEMRPLKLTSGFTENADGSVLVEQGKTRVLCTAQLEDRVPPFLRNQGRGWITAEYGMLPGSTSERTPREAARGKQGGRTVEIQRLIGRSLRASVDLKRLGERTIVVDCDVLQADGGTRTASITGGWVALALCLWKYHKEFNSHPLITGIAGISAGIVAEELLLDLDYEEDFKADVDFNMIMCHDGRLVEMQGTAEASPFSRNQLNALLDLGLGVLPQIKTLQHQSLETFGVEPAWLRLA